MVITHAAYTKALEAKIVNEEGRWSNLIEWEHGQRRLTIIDESLAEIIAEHQVKAEDIRFVLGLASQDLRNDHPWAVQSLEKMLSVLDQIKTAVDTSSDVQDGDVSADLQSSRIVWKAVQEGRVEYPDDMGIGELRSVMSGLPYDLLALKRSSILDRERIRQRVDDTLAACEAILSMWGFYSKEGVDHTLNVLKLLIPPNLPTPVVLDATASQHFLWELLGERAYIHQKRPNLARMQRLTCTSLMAQVLGKQR